MYSCSAEYGSLQQNRLLRSIERAAPWLCLFLATLVLSIGFGRGDVRPAEAKLLLETSHGPITNQNPYAKLLGATAKCLGQKRLPATIARGFSVLALILSGAVLFAWMYRSSGVLAAQTGALAFACSLPLVIVGTQITPVPALTFSILACGWCLSETRLSLRGSAWLAMGIASGLAVVWLAPSLAEAEWVRKPEDRAVAPFYVLLLSLPWSAAIPLLFSRDLWFTLQPVEKRSLVVATVIGIGALGASYYYPAGWLGFAILLSVAGILPFAIASQQRCMNRAALSVTRMHSSLLYLFALGIPAAAIIAGVVRIGIYHQQMEKVEALVITGLIGVALGGAFLHWRRAGFVWIPILSAVVAAKLLYLTAFVPEWDVRRSSRPYAHAIAEHIDDQSPLYTDAPFGVDFEYYLEADVRSLDTLTGPSTVSRFVLLEPKSFEELQSRTGNRWELMRQYQWSAGNPLWLAREVIPPQQASAKKG